MKVRGKVILVTGGARGIGRELVLGLLSRGASVAAIDIDSDALQELTGLTGGNRDNLSTHVVNIASLEEIAILPEKIISTHGAVDGIINNAGIIQPFVRISALDYVAVERVMNINFYGTIYMVKEFLPHLLKRHEAHIVNISSMGGFLPVPGQTVYGASKAAVKLFTEGLNSELSNTNVRVTLVLPGAIGTNIAANSGVARMPVQESGSTKTSVKVLAPAKAARIIIESMEKDRSRVLVGSDSKLMNLLYRINPGFAARMISKRLQSILPD